MEQVTAKQNHVNVHLHCLLHDFLEGDERVILPHRVLLPYPLIGKPQLKSEDGMDAA